jgi:hypothetical protein
MIVEQVKTDSLIPYAFNNREHSAQQVDRIANSIQQFGFNQPLVVDAENVVLVGHGRLEAAKKLGLDTLPVVRVDSLTEAQKRAYRILDNKLQNDSTWNFESLNIELAALEDGGFELEPWGLEILKGPEFEPVEFDEGVAEGMELNASFIVKVPVADSSSFETKLDEILQAFPLASKQKKI